MQNDVVRTVVEVPLGMFRHATPFSLSIKFYLLLCRSHHLLVYLYIVPYFYQAFVCGHPLPLGEVYRKQQDT